MPRYFGGVVQGKKDPGTGRVVIDGLAIIDPRTYVTKAWRDRILGCDGTTYTDLAPVAQGVHDIMAHWGSLVNPLTGKADFAQVNVGQPLAPIPGAVSAPYWTDPGPLLYTVNGASAGYIPASIPGQLDWIKHTDGSYCLQLTSLPGYGDAEAGKRRVQFSSYQIGNRILVCWDISLLMPDGDESFVDPVTGYDSPFLFWQVKGGSLPTWSMGVECTNDPNEYRLYCTFTHSSDSTDAATYRRQYNNSGSGTTNSKSNLRLATKLFKRNQWQDIRIEMWIDERDITAAAGGEGFCRITINGEPYLEWSGPTAMYKDTGGAIPAPPRWYLGIYRHEYSVNSIPIGTPNGMKELDLNRAFDPAPRQRRILFRRGRLLRF